MATVTLTQENFEQTVSSNDIVLVDFWATWCGPCRQFGPVFEAASEKYPDVVFGKIDTDDQQQLAMAAQITSIPTLMAFRDGIAVFRQSGALPLSAVPLSGRCAGLLPRVPGVGRCRPSCLFSPVSRARLQRLRLHHLTR